MESLLLKAGHDKSFGLKERFEWVCEDPESIKINKYVSYDERRYLKNLMKPVSPNGDLKIERIENPYLWGRYVLQYEEMKADSRTENVKEQVMIHGTSAKNACCIANENFNWRLVRRDRFGKGVSFTNDIEYAKTWATETEVYIVSGVLVANRQRGSWGQTIPDDDYDTTTGFTEDTCIKYYDNDSYPYYIVRKR